MELRTSFDTTLFSLFEEGTNEIVLGKYRLIGGMVTPPVDPRRQFYSYRTPQPELLIHISRRNHLPVSENNTEWIYVDTVNGRQFYQTNLENAIETNTGFLSLSTLEAKELLQEILERIDSQRRARAKELAKERNAKNKALAAAKGIKVDELLFQKKVEKMTKKQEAEVARIKEQVSLSFQYSSDLDALEKTIKEARERLETHEIERLNLCRYPNDFKYFVEKTQDSLRQYIKLNKPKQTNKKKNEK